MPPNVLTEFSNLYSTESWEDFKHFNTGEDYKNIKRLIFADQGEVCAYCEKNLKDGYTHLRRIEHYHSKSDTSNIEKNWSLEWNNVIGVCIGGSDTKEKHPLPDNLSCDSHKAYLEGKNDLPIPCDGYVLNPLDMIFTPALFSFDKSTGKLMVNNLACSNYVPICNNFATVDELVENTIKVFNLNCNRLTEERLVIFYTYERIIKSAREKNNTEIFNQLATRWFNDRWKGYFTTRRIILGSSAEKHLKALGYIG